MASWYETRAGAPLVDNSIDGGVFTSVSMSFITSQDAGDLALQEVDLVTVDPVLAGWRHGTKRGRGPRWLLVLLITYYSVGCIFTSVSTISR